MLRATLGHVNANQLSSTFVHYGWLRLHNHCCRQVHSCLHVCFGCLFRDAEEPAGVDADSNNVLQAFASRLNDCQLQFLDADEGDIVVLENLTNRYFTDGVPTFVGLFWLTTKFFPQVI